MTKDELYQLISQLPDDQIDNVYECIKPLLCPQEQEELFTTDDKDPLYSLLNIIAASISSALFDLAQEAKREDKKILSSRLDYSRKRIFSAWSAYQKETR